MVKENPINQCQGCMAGWEIITKVVVNGVKMEYHLVQDGYKNELVACTRHLYEEE